MNDEEHAEYLQLQRHFGDLLRHGAIAIDERRRSTGSPRASRSTSCARCWRRRICPPADWPGTSTAGGAPGIVSIPESEGAAFDRWFDLEQRSSADYQTIVLEQPGTADGRPC